MSRKKINKNSIEYISKNLFYKDKFKGFQFTFGRTPLGIKENRLLKPNCSLLFEDKSIVVIDASEIILENKIKNYLFPENYTISLNKLKEFQDLFKKLDYEVEETEFAGYWYWFRVFCKTDEIKNHLEIIKNNINL